MLVTIVSWIGVVLVTTLVVALASWLFSLAAINERIANSIHIDNQYNAFRYEHNMNTIGRAAHAGDPLPPPPTSPRSPNSPGAKLVILRKSPDTTPRR